MMDSGKYNVLNDPPKMVYRSTICGSYNGGKRMNDLISRQAAIDALQGRKRG